jgi:hypothetical protein
MILCTRSTAPSAKVLRDAIAELNDKFCNMIVSSIPKTRRLKIHIRWGNSCNYENRDLNLNPPWFIETTSNKLSTAEFLNELLIPTVNFYPWHVIPDHYPVFIRHTLMGYKGHGIEIVNNQDEFLEKVKNSYWSYGINSIEEFRFHFVLGEVVKIQRKVPQDPNSKNKPYEIRNSLTHSFKVVSPEKNRKVAEYKEFLESIDDIKGFFFAADVIYDLDYNQFVILELNSAPGLNENTAMLYARKLMTKLDPDFIS